MRSIKFLPAIILLIPGLQGQESVVDGRIREIAGLDVQRARAFFDQIKLAIAKGDKKAVSAMVSYPTFVNIKGNPSWKIRNRSEFETHYDEIITTKVINAVREQAYEDLFVNWQGVMFGNGEIWFTAKRGSSGRFDLYRIVKVNN